MAAASVPECQVALPRFGPRLTPGEDDVDITPLVRADRDAVGRCAVDAVGLDLFEDPDAPVAERAGRGDRVPGRGLLDVRRDHPHLAELTGHARERGDPRTVNAVIVDDQDRA